ncbi:MAG: NADPH-dependent FMN reductase [Acidimicrobiia bacterium]
MTRQPQPTVRLLGLAGSLRARSFNRYLLEAGRELTQAGTTITVYEHLADIPPFNEDLEANPPLGVTRLRQAMQAADGLLIATPEYNQSVPGVLKNVIDWLSRSDPAQGLTGKPVAVIGATTGPWGTRLAQTQLRQILVACQALLLPSPALYLGDARAVFDEAGRLIDHETRDRLSGVIEALVDWTRLLSRPSKIDVLSRAG